MIPSLRRLLIYHPSSGRRTMTLKSRNVAIALIVYGIATAISVAVFRSQGPGLLLDGILLLGLFYYLATLAR
jgi:hypothetical protein